VFSGAVVLEVVAGGGPGKLEAGLSWLAERAESSGEVEAWEFGRAGWTEVTGDGGIWGVSSARTNAGEGYPPRRRVSGR
jgi:hypothetical protein